MKMFVINLSRCLLAPSKRIAIMSKKCQIRSGYLQDNATFEFEDLRKSTAPIKG